MSGPAAQRDVHRLAAVAVGQLDRRPAARLVQVAVAPAQQRDQHRVEVQARLGQPERLLAHATSTCLLVRPVGNGSGAAR
ncbi:MAG TPA: hypothetical protein VEL73_05350 [Mycobacteriales bacterium]|nr:hypothetical protein [Mycobacteriales bacterium]